MLLKLLQKAINRSVKSAMAGKAESLDSALPQYLTDDMRTNLKLLLTEFQGCSDFLYRELRLQANEPIPITLCFLDGITDVKFIGESVIPNMLQLPLEMPHLTRVNALEILSQSVLNSVVIKIVTGFSEVVNQLLGGSLIILIEGETRALALEIGRTETRSIEEPNLEPSVRGPRDGFVENLSTNISLLRRRIRSTHFKTHLMEVGSLSKTRVTVCYIEGVANPKVVNEVISRIQRINIDGVVDSAIIEEFIVDRKFFLFPLMQYTERPDVAVSDILGGSVAIVVDNSPMVLLGPITFNNLLQAAEDYYNYPYFASFVRLARFIGLNIALLLPALVVATFSYHQQLIPTTLLSTIVSTRQQMPFPIMFEILFMELTFELLREAGSRLPRSVGQAVSTVGGLVIGQAAIQAGIVAPVPVIVVALTAIASFTSPNYAAGTTIRLLRLVLIILAGVMGGIGIMFGLMMLLVHLCSLRSFGIPYLSPFAPLSVRDLKDTFIRMPWWSMVTRPRLIGQKQPLRQNPNQGPQKPNDKGGQDNA